MDKHTSLHIELVIFIVPVSLECDRYTFPSVGVGLPESVAAKSDNAFCKNMGLLIKMDVVLAGVVESTDGEGAFMDRRKSLTLKEILHHF